LDGGMKKLLAAMFVALLMVGCGGDDRMAVRKIKEAKENGATELYLSNDQISDLSSLTGLTNLERLYLSNNQISDLSPLTELTNLEWLDLSGNPITDLSPLKGLTNLKRLFFSNNPISDLSPLAGLTNLEFLYFYDNPIPDDQKAMLRKALPNCDISF